MGVCFQTFQGIYANVHLSKEHKTWFVWKSHLSLFSRNSDAVSTCRLQFRSSINCSQHRHISKNWCCGCCGSPYGAMQSTAQWLHIYSLQPLTHLHRRCSSLSPTACVAPHLIRRWFSIVPFYYARYSFYDGGTWIIYIISHFGNDSWTYEMLLEIMSLFFNFENK